MRSDWIKSTIDVEKSGDDIVSCVDFSVEEELIETFLDEIRVELGEEHILRSQNTFNLFIFIFFFVR